MQEMDGAKDAAGRAGELYGVAVTSMIQCPHCGKHFKHVVHRGKSKWACPTYVNVGSAYCRSKRIPDDVLRETTCRVLGWESFDEGRLRETVEHITAFYLKDGREIEAEWTTRSRSDSWTPEMRSKAAEDGRRGRGKAG